MAVPELRVRCAGPPEHLDSASDFPLSAWNFGPLGNDLFASTFDGTAADQIVRRAELIVAHTFNIVSEIGNGFLGFGARS